MVGVTMQNVGIWAVAALGLGACTGRTHAVEAAPTLASSLLDLGKPCAVDSDCTSGFCIDGVCCESTCGGGVRDALTCSNIYGAVAGLTNGTCVALARDDFCGALTSVNPCTWRGSTINGGGQCPNPPGESVACFPCTTSAECDGAFPVCLNNGCVQCDGDFGSGSVAACPADAPLCQNGQCVGCGGCGGTTPACNILASACAACNGDFGSGATLPCPSTTAPACLTTGACAECSATNTDACSGTTPSCDSTTHTCAPCNGDFASGQSQACQDEEAPLCLATGACGKCTSDSDCTLMRLCNTVLGNCGDPCSVDTDCSPSEWCATGVCTPKMANGTPLPAITPVNATCTPDVGTRVCVSGVCDTSDNACGLSNGSTCGPPPSAGQCRSNVCFAADNTCGLPVGEPCTAQSTCRSLICSQTGKCGECATDADCGAVDSGRICDAIEQVCVSGCRGMGGNGCEAGLLCTSVDDSVGKCVACSTDGDCGDAASGTVCDENRQCVAGCRGDTTAGNGCGAGALCTSGDGTIGACLKVEGGGPGCSATRTDREDPSISMGLWLAACASLVLRRRRS